MDSSVHILIASTHAQERIRKATGAPHANDLVREPRRTTPPAKPRRLWSLRSAPTTAPIGPRK